MNYILYSYFTAVTLGQVFAKVHNYDNFDIEALLSNSTRTKSFFECIGDESKCENKEDTEMKRDMLEMVHTSCAKCTEKEKKKFGEAMDALQRSMNESHIINLFINRLSNLLQGNSDKDTFKQ